MSGFLTLFACPVYMVFTIKSYGARFAQVFDLDPKVAYLLLLTPEK
jgi:hypothetical protein